jgi:hypothetical protein
MMAFGNSWHPWLRCYAAVRETRTDKLLGLLYQGSARTTVCGFHAFRCHHLTMTFLLLFVLILLHRHTQVTQLVQASSSQSIALPLVVRSPYMSSWLPQTNASDIVGLGDDPDYYPFMGTNISEACLFPYFDPACDLTICCSTSPSHCQCTVTGMS